MKFVQQALLSIPLALGAVAFTSVAQATVIVDGSGPTPFAIADLPAGSFLASLTSPLITPTYAGTTRAAVYRETSTGFLDFLFQFTNTGPGESIGRITGTPFDGFSTDVFQSAGAIGIFLAGDVDAISVDRGNSGDVVGFDFDLSNGGKIAPGQTSYLLQVRTNATSYMSGFMGVIDGTAGFTPAFVPAVPEPSTYALMLGGLALLGFVRRKGTKV